VRIPILFQDERLSTREADRLLMQANRNRTERKRVVDSVAACLILQAYLDHMDGGNEVEPTDAQITETD
jgi:putative Holliday junction resolvase